MRQIGSPGRSGRVLLGAAVGLVVLCGFAAVANAGLSSTTIVSGNGTYGNQARADALSCGTVLASPGVYQLQADLKCPAASATPALLVQSGGVTIDLNGHSIIGPGALTNTVGVHVGVGHVSGASVLIENGAIRRFGRGAAGTEQASVDVENVLITGNGTGIAQDDFGLNITVRNSQIDENFGDGIRDHQGGHISISGSRIVGNGGNGVSGLETSVFAERNVISRNGGYGIYNYEWGVDLSGNDVSKNGLDGIYLGLNDFGDSYSILNNTANQNGGHGIVYAADTLLFQHPLVSDGNLARKNQTDPQCVNLFCTGK